jgi:CRISPR-associated protein (TIGR03986 family)
MHRPNFKNKTSHTSIHSNNQKNNNPVEVVSNYNFVPAPTEEEVFVATWADQISHDIPFSDGESGEIEIEIEAKTPIFIRNGHAQGADTSEFSHIEINGEKKYFIPATSLKGMIRNNLEIMSFSKLTQFNGEPFFGLRDLNNPQYKQATAQAQIKAGWLKKEGENWKIYPVEHGRVSMRSIETKFNLQHNSIEKAENAFFKYRNFGSNPKINKFLFDKQLIKNPIGFHYGDLYKFDDNGTFEGELVFYGNIRNKHYDYIFQKEGNNSYAVDKKLVENLDNIEKDKENSLWKYFRSQTEQRIPVFFKLENNQVVHFGMSKLYTQNNGKSIKEIAPKYKANIKDLATSIFGNTEDELKGRVFFSNSDYAHNFSVMNPVTVVLNSPKASYYPFYLKQNGVQYNTYVSSNAEMRGYKKYPLHSTLKSSILNADNKNIQSSFKPLSAGTKFKFKVRYFNLRPIELGALLSSLTLHGNHDKLFHSLGGAKPLGYGKVKFNVTLSEEHKIKIKIFEDSLNKHLNKKWIETDQIKELFSMASEPNVTTNATLRYPTLEGPNEFVNIKKAVPIEYLKPYSGKNSSTYEKIVAIQNNAKVEEIAMIEKAEKERIEQELFREKEESEKAFQIAINSDDVEMITNYISTYPNSSHIKKLREREQHLNNERKRKEAELLSQSSLAFDSDKFSDIKSKLNGMLKKNRHLIFSDIQKKQIIQLLKKSYALEKNDKKSDWQKVNMYPKYPWSDIIKWLGEESAEQLFFELTSN